MFVPAETVMRPPARPDIVDIVAMMCYLFSLSLSSLSIIIWRRELEKKQERAATEKERRTYKK